MSQIVRTNQVVAASLSSLSTRTINRMKTVLLKQGQIEPLQVRIYYTTPDGRALYQTFVADVHGADIVLAAQELGWETLLIVVVDRYQY